MTAATVERMRNLRPGWKIRITSEADTFEGVVSEVTEAGFRLGMDPTPEEEEDYPYGTSRFFGFSQGNPPWELEVLDRSGEIEAEVLDKIPAHTARSADEMAATLSPDDPVQSQPSKGTSTVVERPGGYDQHDTNVARTLAGARLDDLAAADAAADRGDRAGIPPRLLCTVYLPISVDAAAAILEALSEEAPEVWIGDTDDMNTMDVYGGMSRD